MENLPAYGALGGGQQSSSGKVGRGGGVSPLRVGAAVAAARFSGLLEGQQHPEQGSSAHLALHVDASAHMGDQMAADGQPQAGAAVVACGGIIKLGKGLGN